MPELPSAEHDGTSIVLVGSFNPRIFQPAWFAAQKLLPTMEGADANVQVIGNDVCIFETDWFRLEVLSERWSLQSQATPAMEAIRDLALGTFTILRHTPITKMGLNTLGHFPLPTEQYIRFGHVLAPKEELWDPILKSPATLTLTIQGERPDDYRGHIRVKVEPSSRVEYGVFIDTNEEFWTPDATPTSTNWAIDILRNEWENYRRRASNIRDHLLTKAGEL